MTGGSVTARAYARGLLGAARACRADEAVEQDLRALGAQWRGSAELRRFCCGRQPGAAAERARLVAALWGGTVDPATLRFLERLAEWGHLRLLPQIAARYAELADRAAGRLDAVATFACEPQEADLARVRQLLAGACGSAYHLDVRVEPALLAGLRLRVGDRLVDASLAGRLARLKQGLLKPAPPAAAATPESP